MFKGCLTGKICKCHALTSARILFVFLINHNTAAKWVRKLRVPGRWICVTDHEWGQDGWILAEFLVTKLKSSHIDRTSLINKGFFVLGKYFASIRNQEWLDYFERWERKSTASFSSTVNTRESLTSSLFLLSSTVFCHFIADTAHKL